MYISTEEDVNETMLLFKRVREAMKHNLISDDDFDVKEEECQIFEVEAENKQTIK